MKVLIVFESMFGNTAALARDVGAGLAEGGMEVVLADLATAPPETPLVCDLLVVAAPTHALSLSRPQSRVEAVARGADPDRAASGLREWLASLESALPPTGPRPPVAVFDTRVVKARHWPGSAARSAARILRRAGFSVVDRISFYVEDIAGPIHAGESERAWSWGRGLTALVQPGAPRREAC